MVAACSRARDTEDGRVKVCSRCRPAFGKIVSIVVYPILNYADRLAIIGMFIGHAFDIKPRYLFSHFRFRRWNVSVGIDLFLE